MKKHTKNENEKFGLDLSIRIVLIVFSILLLMNFSYGWFDQNWNYRQMINISTSSGTTPTGYQINVVLNSSLVGANFNWSRTCNDLRFVNKNDNTLLNYFVKSCSSINQNASIWIKIPQLISTSVDNIYMYYGNPVAISLSNGGNTYDFYDDFESNLSKWTKHKNGANIIISNGSVKIGGGTTSSPYGHGVLGSNATYTNFTDGIIEGQLYLATNAISEIGTRGVYASNQGYKSRADARSSGGVSHLKPPYNDGSWNFLSGCTASGGGVTSGTWLDFIIIINGSSLYISTDGKTRSCTDSQYSGPGEISLQNHYGSYSRYDNISVRKYFANTINIISGLEEKVVFPVLTYANPTLSNNSKTNRDYIYINVTSDVNLTNATLKWNGVSNFNMTGTGTNWYYNVTGLSNGVYSYYVLGYSTQNVSNVSLTRVVNITQMNITYIPPTTSSGILNTTDTIELNVSVNSIYDISSYTDFNKNLLVYLNFENVSGTTVFDDSTYGKDGTLQSGAFISNLGKIRGDYASFDGINDYVSLTGVLVNTSAGAKNTVDFWMYWSGGNSQMPFSWNGAGYDLWLYGGCFGFNTFNGNVLGISSSGLANSWHHIVAVFYNGLANSIDNAIYIDGVKKSISNCLGSVSTSRTINSNPRISGYSGSYNFGGRVDEFRIWKDTLTQGQVTRLYNSSKRYYTSYDFLSDGNYTFKSCAINYDGEFKCEEERNVNITFNQFAPNASYVNPTPSDGEFVNSQVIINTTINSTNFDSAVLRWNGTQENMTCTGSSPTYYCYKVKSGLVEGDNYTFQVTANNTDGVNRTLPQRFIYVIETPKIVLNPPSPSDSEKINLSYTLLNISFNSTKNLSSYIDRDKNLLVYYSFENILGNIIYDESTYARNGSMYNGVYQDKINNIRGNYIQINGGNDYVSVNNLGMNISAGAKNTIEFWMYWTGGTSQMPMGFVGSNYDLWLNSGSFGFNTGNGDIYGFSSSGLANSWHHIVAVFYNGQVSSTNNAIYIDGVKQTITQRLGNSGSKFTTQNLLISGWGVNSGYKFAGKIDEFRVWRGELPPELINFSYNSQKPNFTYNWTNLSFGSHTYEVCTINVYGARNCTQNRAFTYSLLTPSEKKILVDKKITSTNSDIYRVDLNVRNNLSKIINVSVIDFVSNGFNLGSDVPAYNLSIGVSGSKYNGKTYVWNLTLNANESRNISYLITKKSLGSDYKLTKNFIVGGE